MSLPTLSTLSSYSGYDSLMNTQPTFTLSQIQTYPTSEPMTLFNFDFMQRQANPQYNLLSTLNDNIAKQNSLLVESQNSFLNNYIKPAMYGIQGLSTLGSLWLGFQNYKLAKEQLGIAKDQWNQTKQELDRLKELRTKLTNEYMNGE